MPKSILICKKQLDWKIQLDIVSLVYIIFIVPFLFLLLRSFVLFESIESREELVQEASAESENTYIVFILAFGTEFSSMHISK